MKQQATHTIIHAAALRDAVGTRFSPGSILIQDGRIAAVGEPSDIPTDLVGEIEVIDRSGDLLLPQMVNAHTHLELTDIGAQPYDPAGGFVGWVEMLRQSMPVSEQAFAISTMRGVIAAKQAGVQAVGDITHNSVDVLHLDADKANLQLAGQRYIELFGLGPPHDKPALQSIAQKAHALQPHAPYSAGPAIYDAAARSGRPITTHLAETQGEAAFVASLTGPHLDYLQSIGKWDDPFAKHYGKGQSPVQWMRPYLELAASDGGWLVAHCNYVSDGDIAILADTNTFVAYCPIASEYFGHKDHRYRDMLAAGINVCLGTDSIVGTDPNDPQPLGLLSAMRRLYQRDQADPEALLAMATIHGAKALRLDEKLATLQPGAPARFACIPIDATSKTDPFVQVLMGQDPAEAISFDS